MNTLDDRLERAAADIRRAVDEMPPVRVRTTSGPRRVLSFAVGLAAVAVLVAVPLLLWGGGSATIITAGVSGTSEATVETTTVTTSPPAAASGTAGCSFYDPERIDESRTQDPTWRSAHPLIANVASGDLAAVETQLQQGADPDEADPVDGLNALVVAARSGCVEIMQALVDAGASLDPTGAYVPLKAAVQSFNPLAVQYLLESGAQPDAVADWPNGDRSTALWAAADWDKVTIMEMLIQAGADPNRANALGETVMFAAANAKRTEAVMALIAAGAEPDVNALVAAAANGSLPIVQLLVDAGADPHQPVGSDGMTARQAALDSGHTNIVQYIDALP